MSRVIVRPSKCPFCDAPVAFLDVECRTCEGDLSLLAGVRALPYGLYNDALTDLQDDDRWAALEKLVASVSLDGSFEEGRKLLVEVATSLGLDRLAARHSLEG